MLNKFWLYIYKFYKFWLNVTFFALTIGDPIDSSEDWPEKTEGLTLFGSKAALIKHKLTASTRKIPIVAVEDIFDAVISTANKNNILRMITGRN